MSEPKLPRQIQDEIDRAEQIEREIAAMLNPDSVYTSADQPAEAPAPEAPAAETPPPEPAETPAPVEDDPNSETWQARYTALQGKYDAEVPRYAQQLRELRQYAQQLEARLATPPEPPQPSTDELDKEAADLVGEDVVKLIRRMAQAEAERRIAEVKQAQQTVEQRIAQSEQEAFYARVDAAVPGWRQIDTDPAWLGWLQEYDPLLGAPRQAALEQAAQTRDVNRVAHLFKTFQGLRAPSTPPSPQPTRAQLEQVTPRPSGNASAVQSPQAKVYTQADIGRLLDPRHLYRLPREQQLAIERDIDLAVVEGRIAA